MSASDYDDILNRARKEIPEPVDVPLGTWKLQAVSGTFDKSDEEYIALGWIMFKLIEPQDDVDEELFNEFAVDTMESYRVFFKYWLKDLRDVNDLNKVFDAMGMENDTLEETIKSVKGFEVMANVYQKPDKDDPNKFWVNLKSFAPVED